MSGTNASTYSYCSACWLRSASLSVDLVDLLRLASLIKTRTVLNGTGCLSVPLPVMTIIPVASDITFSFFF
jgi:hypothetical protein